MSTNLTPEFINLTPIGFTFLREDKHLLSTEAIIVNLWTFFGWIQLCTFSFHFRRDAAFFNENLKHRRFKFDYFLAAFVLLVTVNNGLLLIYWNWKFKLSLSGFNFTVAYVVYITSMIIDALISFSQFKHMIFQMFTRNVFISSS